MAKYKVLVKNLVELTAKIDSSNECEIRHLGRFTKYHFTNKPDKGFNENLLSYINNHSE